MAACASLPWREFGGDSFAQRVLFSSRRYSGSGVYPQGRDFFLVFVSYFEFWFLELSFFVRKYKVQLFIILMSKSYLHYRT